MNSETNAFTRGVQQSIEASGGLEAYRKHVLQHLQLKAVIKVCAISITPKPPPSSIHHRRATAHPYSSWSFIPPCSTSLPPSATTRCVVAQRATQHELLNTSLSALAHHSPVVHSTPQATVYDDAHMGDSLAVVVHFTNKATQHAPGGVR